jgi:thiol-disulfide isomerase/thioredoxin
MPSLTRREALCRISGMTLAALLSGCGRPGSTPPRAGVAFPPFALPDTGGRIHRSSDYADSPLLVNFWATWCPPCRAEMPDLQALHLRLAPRGLRILGINVDDDANLAREFLLKNPVDFTILLDSQRALADQALRLDAYPMSFLVGRDGVIVEAITGIRPWADAAYAELIARRLALA